MPRHQTFTYDNNVFNCAFSSRHFNVTMSNCRKGAVYLFLIKTAICILDLTSRIEQYERDMRHSKCNQSIKNWIADHNVWNLRTMPKSVIVPTSNNYCIYHEYSLPHETKLDIATIKRIHNELVTSTTYKIKLPDLPSLDLFSTPICDKVRSVDVQPFLSKEQLTLPWFRIYGKPKWKFCPHLLTHNSVGFRMAIFRLMTTIDSLAEFVEFCARYREFDVTKANHVIDILKSKQLENFDMEKLFTNQTYLGGLRHLQFDKKQYADNLQREIDNLDAFPAHVRNAILNELRQ